MGLRRGLDQTSSTTSKRKRLKIMLVVRWKLLFCYLTSPTIQARFVKCLMLADSKMLTVGSLE